MGRKESKQKVLTRKPGPHRKMQCPVKHLQRGEGRKGERRRRETEEAPHSPLLSPWQVSPPL